MAHSFTQEYLQIPAVTRAYTTACVVTTAAVVSNLQGILEILTVYQLINENEFYSSPGGNVMH